MGASHIFQVFLFIKGVKEGLHEVEGVLYESFVNDIFV